MLDFLLLEFGIFFRGGDDEAVPVPANGERETFGDFRKERMDEVGNDQANERGAAGDQASGSEVGPVTELFDLDDDAFAGRLADIGMIPQRLGNGHHGNAEFAGDILHVHGHRRNYTQGPLSQRWTPQLACA